MALEWPGPDGAAAYIGMDLGASHLGIGVAPGSAAVAHGRISMWVYTDDGDGLVWRLREAGHTITEEPEDRPWGERVARVLDPDGNEVIIGQRTAPGSAPG